MQRREREREKERWESAQKKTTIARVKVATPFFVLFARRRRRLLRGARPSTRASRREICVKKLCLFLMSRRRRAIVF